MILGLVSNMIPRAFVGKFFIYYVKMICYIIFKKSVHDIYGYARHEILYFIYIS